MGDLWSHFHEGDFEGSAGHRRGKMLHSSERLRKDFSLLPAKEASSSPHMHIKTLEMKDSHLFRVWVSLLKKPTWVTIGPI